MKLLNYYKYLIAVSIAILVLGVGSLAVYGLNLGIDFKGGTVTEVKFEKSVDQAQFNSFLTEQNIGSFQTQPTDNNGIIFKTGDMEKSAHDNLLSKIKEKFGNFEELRFESIGPVVGEQLTKKAIYQLLLVSIGIIIYIAYAFRKVNRPISSWQFGVAAIVALLHDLLVVLGVFSILGHYLKVEVDSMFVTAMLTVLGFSVHDTIIVFDRIRENLRVYGGKSLEFIVNHSISQTLVRSLNTSLTVLLVLLALLLFGGDTIRYFVLALFIGIAVGTYSSIFVASPTLVIWQNWKNRKLAK